MENGISNQLDYLSCVDSEPKTERFRRYFNLIGNAAESGIFDIIAHFDLPKRFWGGLDAASYEFAEQALKKIKQNDLCVEVNTSGFRTKNIDEPFPDTKLLLLAKQMGIPVTLGSDSHQAKHVASFFREAVNLLKEIGFEKITIFTERKRQFIAI